MATRKSDERPKDILPSMSRDEKILDVVGTVTSLAPVLGGPLSSIFMGISGDRRFERARRVIIEVAERLGTVEADQEAFVRSEDFEDLLIETLQRVAAERDEGKRQEYRNILLNVVRDSGRSYDETLRFLQFLQQLQPDHIKVLRAYDEEPPAESTVFAGSRRQTLRERLPDMSTEHVDDIVQQLEDLRLTTGPLGGMVTGRSACTENTLHADTLARILVLPRSPLSESREPVVLGTALRPDGSYLRHGSPAVQRH